MVINYSRHDIQKSDINSVVQSLRSDWITTGPLIKKFETSICNITTAKHGVAVNSATSALHVACLALGLGKGDVLWTCSNTFVASANCGLYCGAKVDFVDIDPETYNISIKKLKEKLINAKKKKLLPKIIIPVAFAGHSCEMKEIKKLSKIYNFKIIEDASHALGAKYFNRPVGSCDYSDVTVFSFHPVKIITTGEGGVALTNDYKLANKMRALRSHGIYKTNRKRINNLRPWMFYQKVLGFNYRMTDIHAALGISQLKRLSKFVKKRNAIAKIYNKSLTSLPLKLPTVLKHNKSSFHLYVVQVKKNVQKISRDYLYKKLKKFKINTNIHYIPVYKHPYFKNLKLNKNKFLENNKYFKNAISLPIYPSMKKKQIQKVINSLKKIFKY